MSGVITVLAMSVALVLFGLFYRSLRRLPNPSPDDPALTHVERIGAAQRDGAVTLAPWLIRIGLAGVLISGVALIVLALS